MIRQQAVLPRGGKNVVREHAASTRLPLDGGRGAPRGGDNPFMGRTFGLTNVASVPDCDIERLVVSRGPMVRILYPPAESPCPMVGVMTDVLKPTLSALV